MQTKLTLRLEKDLVDQAKVYASKQGKSVSRMVADYFLLLHEKPNGESEELTPIVKSLKGALRGVEINELDYKKHLEDKYL
ncbi:MAG: antitoxin [SAR324 cluster bacterium]|nr:antitoxin [SAR324 cluster bacterium]